MIKVQTKKAEFKGPQGGKQAILDKLCETLRMTTAGDDLKALRYDAKKELVHVDFECCYDHRQINVAMDSGFTMIKDVINGIHL